MCSNILFKNMCNAFSNVKYCDIVQAPDFRFVISSKDWTYVECRVFKSAQGVITIVIMKFLYRGDEWPMPKLTTDNCKNFYLNETSFYTLDEFEKLFYASADIIRLAKIWNR